MVVATRNTYRFFVCAIALRFFVFSILRQTDS
jgi:hypothetical protein